MTPLAYQIVKQSWLPLKRRHFVDEAELLKRGQMNDIHCFEVTGVFELADDLGKKWHDTSIGKDGLYQQITVDKTFAFLPAPNTWLEWSTFPDGPKGGRMGVLLNEVPEEGLALCTFAQTDGSSYLCSLKDRLVVALRGNKDFTIKFLPNPRFSQAWQITFLLRTYAFLALINSPKVIGRRQHMPHKALIKNFGVGKFPLHAWTEIKLEVNKPIEINDGSPHEAQLTGHRALHFCRAHVRIRLGKLEYVVSHWRGDPAIGIKQSRYVAVKSQSAA